LEGREGGKGERRWGRGGDYYNKKMLKYKI